MPILSLSKDGGADGHLTKSIRKLGRNPTLLFSIVVLVASMGIPMKASSDTDIGSPVKKGWKVAVQHGTHMISLYAHFGDLRVAVGAACSLWDRAWCGWE